MTFAAIFAKTRYRECPSSAKQLRTGASSAHLSEDEGGETGDGSEDGGASKASGTSLSRGRLRDGLVATSGRGDGGGLDRSSLDGRARNLNGLGLNSSDGGDVLLGDVGGGVAGALRLSRHGGNDGLAGHGRNHGLRRLRRLAGVGRDGAVASRGRGNDGGDRADGGRDGDGLGHNDGRVSRAVRLLRGAVDDGVDLGGIDGRGGHGDGLNVSPGRAVDDIGSAGGDGRDLSRGDVVSGDGGLGVGHSRGGNDGDSRETHLD